MRRIVVHGMVGSLAVAVMAQVPAARAEQPDTLLAQIKQRGTIKVCDAAYPPYNVKDPKTGDWQGLDDDITAALSTALGVKVDHVDTSFSTLIPSLGTRKCDLSIAATYITPARAEQVLFTRSFAEETKTIFVPESSTAKTYGDIDKEGVTIAVRAGTAEETYAKRFFKHATVKTLTSDATQPHLLEVAAGRADAAFAGNIGSRIFIKQNPNLKLRPLGDKLLDPTPFAFMLPLGEYHFQQYLDAFLDDLERTGKLGELREKWLGTS